VCRYHQNHQDGTKLVKSSTLVNLTRFLTLQHTILDLIDFLSCTDYNLGSHYIYMLYLPPVRFQSKRHDSDCMNCLKKGYCEIGIYLIKELLQLFSLQKASND